MLPGCKNIYKQTAERIPGWDKLSKSDLIRKYCEFKNDPYYADAYMSAIMLKYWGSLNKYYYGKSHSEHIYIEDCYDWLTQAVTYVTECQVWNKPYICKVLKTTGENKKKKNPLYGNPDGPNIALNRCIASMRLGFYQASNYDVRRVNYNVASLDQLNEENQDYLTPVELQEYNTNSDSLIINNIIINYFNSNNYYNAFLLDGIVNGDVFDVSKTGVHTFNKKKLAKHLRYIDDNYCHIISKNFNLPDNKIIEASKVYRNLNTNKMYKLIDKSINDVKKTLKLELFV